MYSNLNKAILIAAQKGYRVDKDGSVVSPSGRILYTSVCNKGYLRFIIRKQKPDNGHWKVYVHKLQAYQKFGIEMFDSDCVRRLDNVKTNNTYDNIDIGSIMDNWMDIPARRRMEICSTANQKYDIATVKEIRAKHRDGVSMKTLMAEYNITSKGTFSHILNKRLVNY